MSGTSGETSSAIRPWRWQRRRRRRRCGAARAAHIVLLLAEGGGSGGFAGVAVRAGRGPSARRAGKQSRRDRTGKGLHHNTSLLPSRLQLGLQSQALPTQIMSVSL